MRHRGFKRVSIGWDRVQLVDAGILPGRAEPLRV
jgi:hypothetical protein